MESLAFLDGSPLTPVSCVGLPGSAEACLAYLVELRVGSMIEDVSAMRCARVGVGVVCVLCCARGPLCGPSPAQGHAGGGAQACLT